MSQVEYDFLIPDNLKMAPFYGLLKIHKGTSPLKGRPIVSRIDGILQNPGIFVDTILMPFVEALPSHTCYLLGRLKGLVLD